INPVDERSDPLGHATYIAGVAREIDEEIALPARPQQKIVALLNDDSNPVGRVHLGVVHLFELESMEAQAREDALSDLQFKSTEELQGPLYDLLESWSRFCVDALNKF
ncbi:MAG TPA: hypothetical protein DD438_04930, partial [Verrucomicrobiales bacterium]|nr:hypothetical protein [Verrucomicrobiales bacterium]